jgi:hypothetical protein
MISNKTSRTATMSDITSLLDLYDLSPSHHANTFKKLHGKDGSVVESVAPLTIRKQSRSKS